MRRSSSRISCRTLDGAPLEPGAVDGQPFSDRLRVGFQEGGDLVQRQLQLTQPPDGDRLSGLLRRVVPVARPFVHVRGTEQALGVVMP